MTITINGIAQDVPSKEDYGAAVQDIAALKAIPPEDRFDQQRVFVEDEERPYHFDLQSTAGESLPAIAIPNDAPATGRWIRLPPEAGGVPAAHATSHQDGGTDEISVTAFSGLLADDQNPTAHKADHISGGSDAFAAADILESASRTVRMRLRNETGGSIPKGTLVAVSGFSVPEGRPLVAVADKDDSAARPALAVTEAAVANNTNFDGLVLGTLTGLNTSAFSANDQLVLGDAGAVSRPPPDVDPFTGEVQLVGSTVRIDASNGSIFFNLATGLLPMTAAQFFLTKETGPTGNVTGGEVTRATGLNVDVASGSGFVNDDTDVFRVVFGAVVDLALTLNATNFIFVDKNGVVQASTSVPALGNNIVLADAITDASSVILLANHQVLLRERPAIVHEYAREVIGNVVVSGLTTTKDAIALRLEVDAGTFYTRDFRVTVPATDPITFTYWFRDGVGGFSKVVGRTVIDENNFDDGSGVLAALLTTEFKKDLLFVVFTATGLVEYHVFYGQEKFTSQSEAEAGNLPSPDSDVIANAVRSGGIVQEGAAATIASVVDVRTFVAQLAPGTTAVSDHGLLSGLADDDHPGLLPVSGVRPMTGPLDMGANAITNVGLVDGEDISAHVADTSNPHAVTAAQASAIAIGAAAGGDLAGTYPNPTVKVAGARIIKTTEALETIIEAASAGDHFVLEPGAHSIPTDAILIPANDITIEGPKSAVVEGSNSVSNFPVFDLNGRSGLTLRGFTIKSPTNGARGIESLAAVSRLVFEDLLFQKVAATLHEAIRFNLGVTDLRITRVRIENANNWHGFVDFEDGTVGHVIIEDCETDSGKISQTAHHFDLDVTFNGPVILRRNRYKGWISVIDFDNATKFAEFLQNFVEGTGGVALDILQTTGTGMRVEGNIFDACNRCASFLGGAVIPSGLRFRGNIIRNSVNTTGNDVRIESFEESDIHGNTLLNGAMDIGLLLANCDRSKLVANRINDYTKAGAVGLQENADNDRVRYYSNFVEGNTQDLNLLGTNRFLGDLKVASVTIQEPDLAVRADIPFMPIEIEQFPDGSVIERVKIKTSVAGVYSVDFRHYDDAVDVTGTLIATVATGAGEDEKESGALTVSAAAGRTLGVRLPATDIDLVVCTVYYRPE